jgi:hypothetical protein
MMMKKLFHLLLFLFPIIAFTQQSGYKSSPQDYMWKYLGNAGFSAGSIASISIAFNQSGQLYIAYMDVGATVMKFDGLNWAPVGGGYFSSDIASDISLAIRPTDGQPYVAFTDNTIYPNGKATVMKFDGTNWMTVGLAGFSADIVDYTKLCFNQSGEPYVAYEDYGNLDKATVMKFNGANWATVGNAGFSTGKAEYISFAFDPSGQPYIAYTDWGNSIKATVMTFDGTFWVNIGIAGFSAGRVDYVSLAINPLDGQPCVAFRDWANGMKSTVMKFDGTNWVNVGIAGFSAGTVDYTSLAINPLDGQPYVAYNDHQFTPWGRATVMKFDGTNWISVGTAGFSAGEADLTCLALSPYGQPYLAYKDIGYDGKVSVLKYDSVFVGINEFQESRLSVHPNPATGIITVETSATPSIPIATRSKLSITNLNGVEIMTRQITKPKTLLDISNLPNGIYFVRLTNDRTLEVRKLIKK